jgi:thiamine biosynthesis protein ThiI
MKMISLVSGGIDSPVAIYLMLKQGVEMIALHLDNRPFTDDKEVRKAIALVEHLEKISKSKIKKYLVSHKENQVAFASTCNRHQQCVLCRRMMLRVGEKIAGMTGASALVTGESLGQVASQTIENIKVENQSVKIPILRPLIGLDKVEIIDIAKEIGTYKISIRPGVCCTIVPKKPSTRSELGRILAEEKKIDIDSLLDISMESLVIS